MERRGNLYADSQARKVCVRRWLQAGQLKESGRGRTGEAL